MDPTWKKTKQQPNVKGRIVPEVFAVSKRDYFIPKERAKGRRGEKKSGSVKGRKRYRILSFRSPKANPSSPEEGERKVFFC